MIRFIRTAGIIGFFLCLSIMYMTKLGARGIREYDPLFRMPDMQFHYSAEQLTGTFERIGEEGRSIFRNYLFLDFAFTLCFGIVMITLTNTFFAGMCIRPVLTAVCIARGLADVLENSLLLSLIHDFPELGKLTISLSSAATSIKFMLLFIWLAACIVQTVITGITRIKV